MSKVETILEEIKGLTLLEASDLVKKMERSLRRFRRGGHGCGCRRGAAQAERHRPR